ncbi:DegT/DnrJ/EryC1/StrS family aminotransferase [Roseospira visakhapatnamensis]|uniref:dTDP-4-amino-4,6-dideoxygalactose transaminase n=1 Tax=Roseospira visakhapatnamensis TaxID=390880 RepID=A0A7W6RAZ5_9PROT|nr:DegT/DnrJ/EryC1/StrS family aminotransferase [Roseospira visakhapatnamensis]MBB4264584.1 dTDP-4-amino-4,6-dideoxygalactose transaminase [Roseospira visakhapatnamensis]
MTIPFFPPDLFEADRPLIHDLVFEAGTTNRFMLKDHVAALEDGFRRATGAADAIAVSSGTFAVLVALKAAGVGPGDEVIVQAYCCQPVASQVIALGATPVFVDVTADTMVMDPARVEERITPRTRAILPAHLFSCLVDMAPLRDIARRHGLVIVEDACVQQGATQDGVAAGRLGDVGTFSFFQVKAMGGCGEGGMIVTDDPEIGRRCRMLRNHGQDGATRFLHHIIGFNSRMDEIMAGFLNHRLARFDDILRSRARIAASYTERLSVLGNRITLPPPGVEGRCYYIYAVQSPDRDALRAFLLDRGIATHIYYPRILPHQRAFAAYADPRDRLDTAIRAARQNLALPIYPHMTDAQADAVVDGVLAFHTRH